MLEHEILPRLDQARELLGWLDRDETNGNRALNAERLAAAIAQAKQAVASMETLAYGLYAREG